MLLKKQSLILEGSSSDAPANTLKKTDHCHHSLLKSEFFNLPFFISGKSTGQFFSTQNAPLPVSSFASLGIHVPFFLPNTYLK